MTNKYQNSENQIPLMLTTDELAAQLRISRTLLYQLRTEGKIPAPTKFGRRILWPRDEILAWIKFDCPNAHRWQQHKKNLLKSL
ncbi:MAG: helix-turn-helix domain-containing protein [Phycisphaerae bacterium]|nr:helix-turn-helix domain-containing protein [Phycisphaerae bacterium]